MRKDSRAVSWANRQGSVRAVGRWCASVLVVGVLSLIASAADSFEIQHYRTKGFSPEPAPAETDSNSDSVTAEAAPGTPVAGGIDAPESGAPSSSAEDRGDGQSTPSATSPPRAQPRPPANPVPAPSVPTGPTDLPLGFNETPSGPGWDTEQVSRAVADMYPGAVFRFSVEWAQAQPHCAPSNQPLFCRTPQPFDWTPVDGVLGTLRAHGLRALPFLTSAPPWAWGWSEYSIRPEQRMPPSHDDTGLLRWREFVRAFVAHATSTFPGVLVGVEIWNEQNGSLFWTTSAGVNPARYRDLLCSAYAVSKSVAPSLPVLFGGTNYTNGTPGLADGELQVGEFIGAAYDAGARGCFDVLSLHPHIMRLDLAPDDPNNKYVEYIDEARTTAASHGDAGRPIWLTEVGYPTHPQQAERDLKLYDIAARMPDVDLFLFGRVFDAAMEDAPFGVCQRPGVPKPVASALKQRFTGSASAATC